MTVALITSSTMMITGRIPVVSAAALAVLALSGCESRDTKAEPASSTSSMSATSTTAATSSAPATSAPATSATSSVSTSSATTSAAAAPAGDKVGPADLPAIVSNRTFRGVEEGESYSEFYAPDGSLRGKSGAKAYTGNWKVVGEQLCFSYADTGDTDTECYTVFKNGDVISWVDENGTIVEAEYVEGNADGL